MNPKEDHKCIPTDELLAQAKDNIEKFGLHVLSVMGTQYSPSFSYSVGLYQTYNHPEIICIGLPINLGHTIINDVAAIIQSGETISINKNYDNIFENSSAVFLEVDQRNIADYFGTAINYYGKSNFHALQLVWTDRNDKFPWEADFEAEFLHIQPLLDRNADFKFREAKNLRVFTTRQWLDLGKPILHVVHDDNGDWQFLTNDQTLEDAQIVALEQLVLHDKTLNELFELDYGYEADREFIGGEWTITKVEYDEEE
jgi:hypothetical protein